MAVENKYNPNVGASIPARFPDDADGELEAVDLPQPKYLHRIDLCITQGGLAEVSRSAITSTTHRVDVDKAKGDNCYVVSFRPKDVTFRNFNLILTGRSESNEVVVVEKPKPGASTTDKYMNRTIAHISKLVNLDSSAFKDVYDDPIDYLFVLDRSYSMRESMGSLSRLF